MKDNSSFDTIVVGGGIIGLSTADALMQRGERILLLEQFAPGNDRGSSHGDGRIIRFAYPETVYVQMAQLAYPAWSQLEQRAKRKLFRRTGGLDIGPVDSPELTDVANNFDRFNISYEQLEAQDVSHRFPQFQLERGEHALYQADSGVVFANHAVSTLWKVVSEAGATLLPHRRVVGIDPQNNGLVVADEAGNRWQAERVVVAAGAWANSLLQETGLQLPLNVTQEQVAYFQAAATPDHSMYKMPVFINYESDRLFYGLPHIEVQGVKIAGHHVGQPRNPDQPLPLDEGNSRHVAAFARKRFPHLAEEAHYELSCLYTSTPDHDFILDRHPQIPQLTIGAGFSGHGFKFGPLIGELLADISRGEPSPLPLNPFALDRFNTT